MLNYVFLVTGFALLIKGADFFVDGSAGVAHKLRIPTMIIGLTIVAMGTSAPECAVSIAAALKGSNTMAISNVVGSNIFNLMVVCGACAVFAPLTVKRSTMKQEFPLSILAAAMLWALGSMNMSIGRMDGVILLAVFTLFLIWMVMEAKQARSSAGEEEVETMKGWQCLLYILVGIGAIVAGGRICSGFRHCHCRGFWSEFYAHWPYHCSIRNLSAGTGYLTGSGQEGSDGHGSWKCYRVQYF